MSKVNGRMTTCDRCGCEVFSKCIDEEVTRAGYTIREHFEPLPTGWAWHPETGQLCPNCEGEYQMIIYHFNMHPPEVKQ